MQKTTEEQIHEWLDHILTKPANGVVLLNSLDYSFRYDHRAGFKISVPIGRNMVNSGFMFCNLELLHGKKAAGPFNESYLFKKIDSTNSQTQTPIWSDGNQWFRQYLYQKNMIAVFKVVVVNELLEVSSQGWTAAAIFDDRGYVKYGNYILPLVC
jgi:hypothetical protein